MSLLELQRDYDADISFVDLLPEGMGREEISASDVEIGRLVIAQDPSPQIKPHKAEYIEGATVGDIIDTGLGAVREAVLFCPVTFMKRWVEWAPRKTQEGVVQIHHADPFLDPSFNPGNNEVRETMYFFGWIMEDDGSRRPTYIAMTSTHLKNARRLITLSSSELVSDGEGNKYIPPLCYRTYVLTTRRTGNAQGEWFIWNVERGPTLAQCCEATDRTVKTAYLEAKDFNDAASGHFILGAAEEAEQLTAGDGVENSEEVPF